MAPDFLGSEWVVIQSQLVEVFSEKAARGDRLNHIALEVEDAEAMRSYLGSRGVQVPLREDEGRSGSSPGARENGSASTAESAPGHSTRLCPGLVWAYATNGSSPRPLLDEETTDDSQTP